MKKLGLLLVISALLILNACVPISQPQTEFEEEMMIGKWRSGSEFYRYNSDYKGYSWDTIDDIQESDVINDSSAAFTWNVELDQLTLIYSMQMVGDSVIPKLYTLTELTDSTLKYHDDYSNFSFIKVE